MISNAQNPGAVVRAVGETGVRKNRGWFLALGFVQIVVGTLAVGFAVSATLASVVTLGVQLLIAGAAQTAAALLAREWDGFFLFMLLAFLYAVAGFLTLEHPLQAAEGLTLMLAALFLVVGLFRIAVALVGQVPSWGCPFFTGSSPCSSASPSGCIGPHRAFGWSARWSESKLS
jgi:uncharacterized membrane protein HdeD (DUF308 family)